MSKYTIAEIRNLFVPDRYNSTEFNEKIHILCHDSQVALQKKLDSKRYVKKTFNSHRKRETDTQFHNFQKSEPTERAISAKTFNIKHCLNKLSPKTITSLIKSLDSYDYSNIDLNDIFKQLHTSIVNMPLLYDEIFKLHSNLDHHIDNFTNQFYQYVSNFVKETNYVKASVAEQSLERTIRWLEYTLKYMSQIYWLRFYENYTQDICDIIDMFMKPTSTNDIYGLKMLKVVFDIIGKLMNKIMPHDRLQQLIRELTIRETKSTIKDKVAISEILKCITC
jgi:hypothetical protein